MNNRSVRHGSRRAAAISGLYAKFTANYYTADARPALTRAAPGRSPGSPRPPPPRRGLLRSERQRERGTGWRGWLGVGVGALTLLPRVVLLGGRRALVGRVGQQRGAVVAQRRPLLAPRHGAQREARLQELHTVRG